MGRFALALCFALTAAGPALAQSPEHIARAEAGGDCPGCNLFQIDLSYRDLPGRTFARARLRQANLRAGAFERTNFQGADLKFVDGSAGIFQGARFDFANLENALLINGDFARARFHNANLKGANVAGAELQDSVGLTQKQLNSACGDEFTRLPSGLSVPKC